MGGDASGGMAEGKGKEMQVEAWLEGREKRTKKGSMHGRRSGFGKWERGSWGVDVYMGGESGETSRMKRCGFMQERGEKGL